MRKLKILQHVSLDGIIQSPNGGEGDGYPYEGWAIPYRDPEGGKAVFEVHSKPFDLLLGRRTYDLWATFWPGSNFQPMSDAINGAKKFVATHHPDSLRWGPCEALGPDLIPSIQKIKASEGPDLILWGSSTLASPLLEHGLADEVMLFLYPVLLGKGKRFFAGETACAKLTCTGSKATASGILINTYAPKVN